MIGLVISKAMMSIGMLGILGVGLLQIHQGKRWQQLAKQPVFLANIGIFLVALLSGLYTENWQMQWNELRILLPLLGMPIAFIFIPEIPKKLFYSWLYIFSIIITIATIGVLINYFAHYAEMQIRLTASQAIPTPNRDHIRFSLMLCFALFSLGYLRSQLFIWRWAWERWAQIIIISFLFISIHILSVRSGLLALYSVLFILLIRWIILRRRLVLGAALLLALVSAPFAAYHLVPSVKVKYGLMRHSLILFKEGKIGEYSDTQRLLSYYVAWEVAKQNPYLGVGMGDVRDEQIKYYKQHYPNIPPKYPHNQFLLWYVGTGVWGFLCCVAAFFLPLFYRRYRNNVLFLSFFILIFTSFLTENTLPITIGATFYSFFFCAIVRYADSNNNIAA